jgi:DNA-binding beta-propeller fold protein YncE
MFEARQNSKGNVIRLAALAVVVATLIAAPSTLYGDKKKKQEAQPQQEESIIKRLDYSKIVWPNPPAITRIKYLDYFAGEKYAPPEKTKKSSWMDRMAGSQTQAEKQAKAPFSLWTPYGLAVDSKNRLYVADGKVGAVFIFSTDSKDVEMIKHGAQARFGLITGLAMDDNDRLFVSDSHMHRVLIFAPNTHKLEGTISEGMADPGGMAIDKENRFLYVADAELDQVLVYDADKFNLIRKIGTCCKSHTLTSPGDFSKPTNVAVDNDGNVYVTDTYNNRVEIFDADGQFIRAWGKNGDGPGKFSKPKGIAIDGDGHVWVADPMQDRVQVFTPEGKLLIYFGMHGTLPGQFRDIAGLAIDKNNRVFTSEQFPGRVQMFQYITNSEARAEFDRREAQKKGGTKQAAAPAGKTASVAEKDAAKAKLSGSPAQ